MGTGKRFKQCGYGHARLAWDRTVWIEGMMKPCATPTSTRAAVMAPEFAAVLGVNKEAADQSRKESISMMRPP